MFATAHHLAEQFPRALQRMEQSRDATELVSFFADDAAFSNLGADHDDWRGVEGARHFWQAYLDRFASIRSELTHLHMSERAVVLEWISEGQTADAPPLSYRGVSVLAFEPHGKISGFRTYYDSAAFVGKAALAGGRR